jgi:hypothetical protein
VTRAYVPRQVSTASYPNFIVLPFLTSARAGRHMCESLGFADLASLHSLADVNHAKELCGGFAMVSETLRALLSGHTFFHWHLCEPGAGACTGSQQGEW